MADQQLPRAFIVAPNRSEIPGTVQNEAAGVMFIIGPGKVDWKFKTIDDQGEFEGFMEHINVNNPELADYVRERLDQPWVRAMWEVEVRPGDTVDTVFQRMLDAEKG